MNKNKIILDTILNTIATALPILILQIVILPIVGNTIGEVRYGEALTKISILTFLSLPMGNVLNNIRLLLNNELDHKGDYNLITIFNAIINIIALIIIGYFYKTNPVSLILIIIISVLNIYNEYLKVSFRIKLNYRRIIIDNIILAIGYFVGLLIFYIIGWWEVIYLTGYGFSFIYLWRRTNLLNEGIKPSKHLKTISYKYLMLFISIFLKTATTYADKLILYPLMGPTVVSIYYTSTLSGKVLSMIFSSVSVVFLSYLVKMKHISKKNIFKLLITLTVISVAGYFIILILSGPILNLLYPAWAEESMKLVPITSITAMIALMVSILNPILLRFKNINWQLVINLISIILYLSVVIILYKYFGIYGFVSGIAITNFVKMSIIILIIMFSNDTVDS